MVEIVGVAQGGKDVKVKADIVNLSEGGLCVAEFIPLPAESYLVMNFTLPGGQTIITASGRLKWASEEKNETFWKDFLKARMILPEKA